MKEAYINFSDTLGIRNARETEIAVARDTGVQVMLDKWGNRIQSQKQDYIVDEEVGGIINYFSNLLISKPKK